MNSAPTAAPGLPLPDETPPSPVAATAQSAPAAVDPQIAIQAGVAEASSGAGDAVPLPPSSGSPALDQASMQRPEPAGMDPVVPGNRAPSGPSAQMEAQAAAIP